MKTVSIARRTSFWLLLCIALSLGAPGKIYGSRVAAWGKTNGFPGSALSGLTNVKAIAGGGNFSLILQSDGTVSVIGYGNVRSSNVFMIPIGLSNVIAVAAGDNHALALNGNGKVVAWGYGIFGETNVPTDLSNVVAVAAGTAHSLALRSDGTVAAWGSNSGNQTIVPAGLKDVKAIAAGGSNMVLRHDDTVVAWSGHSNVPVGLAGVRAIASGSTFNLALKADGTVVAWGSNTDGQLDIPSGATNVIAIEAGIAHAVALRADGVVIAWGRNNFGQTNVPPGLTNITAIAAGANYNLALTLEQRVQILRQPQNQDVPYTSNAAFSVIAIGAEPLSYQWFRDGFLLGDGSRYSGANTATFAISNAQFADAGSYRVTVSNAFGAVSSSNATLTVISPPSITSQSPDRTVGAGTNVIFYVTATGTPPLSYQWSFNGTNLPGRTTSSFTLSNVQTKDSGTYSVLVTNAYGQAQTNVELYVTNTVPYFLKQPFVRNPNQTTTTNPIVPRGGSVIFEIDAKGSAPLRFQWQFNGANIFNATNATLALSNLQYDQTGFYTIVASNAFGQTVSAKIFLNVVQVFAWGDPFTDNTNTPVGLTNVIAITAGGSHITVLKSDGTLKAWLARPGLVYGSTAVTNIPPSATNIVAIHSGTDHTLALRSNGTVIAWGGNASGQTNVPPNLSNVVAVAAGFARSFAIKQDGSIVGWGTQGIVPPGLSNGLAISIAKTVGSRNYALRRDGTVMAWPTVETFTGVSNVVAIEGTSSGFLALKSDGTVWSSTQKILFPQNLSNVVEIAGNHSDGLALKADGTIVGSTIIGNVPKLTNVIAIASGGEKVDFGVALIGNGAPAITLQPFSQEPQKGAVVHLHARAAGVQPMKYQWQFENQNISGSTNASLLITNMQGQHIGGYRMLASNALGSVFTATAHLTIPFSTNLAASLNATNLVWSTLSTPGTVNHWFAQIRETHDGDVAAQSGGISHNQQSQLATIIVGPGTLTFWWKVSSETGYDFLKFSLNNETVPLASISGEAGWEKKTFSILPGQHVLRWAYSKDGTVNGGRDAGWLDEVVFTSLLPRFIRHPFDQTVSMGANITIPAIAESTTRMTFQWLKNGTNLSGATAQYLTLTNVTFNDSATYTLQVSNLYGSVTSSNAVLTVIAPLQLKPIQFLSDGSAMLFSDGASGEAFEVQASTNVKDWITLPITPTLTNGSLMFHDTNTKNFPMRFYRIVEH